MGGKDLEFGGRTPAIWFKPGSFNLEVRIGDSEDSNWGFYELSSGFTAGNKSHVSIECKGRNVTVTIDNRVFRATQPTSRFVGNVTVFAIADRWWDSPAAATIENMYLETFTPACQEGWALFHDFCYRYFPQEVYYNEAKSTCRSSNSFLVSVHSAEENQFLVNMVLDIDSTSRDVRLGISDEMKEGVFVNEDGTPVDFTSFDPNQSDANIYTDINDWASLMVPSGLWGGRSSPSWYKASFICKTCVSCSPRCGDGKKEGSEACDDGNTIPVGFESCKSCCPDVRQKDIVSPCITEGASTAIMGGSGFVVFLVIAIALMGRWCCKKKEPVLNKEVVLRKEPAVVELKSPKPSDDIDALKEEVVSLRRDKLKSVISHLKASLDRKNDPNSLQLKNENMDAILEVANLLEMEAELSNIDKQHADEKERSKSKVLARLNMKRSSQHMLDSSRRVSHPSSLRVLPVDALPSGTTAAASGGATTETVASPLFPQTPYGQGSKEGKSRVKSDPTEQGVSSPNEEGEEEEEEEDSNYIAVDDVVALKSELERMKLEAQTTSDSNALLVSSLAQARAEIEELREEKEELRVENLAFKSGELVQSLQSDLAYSKERVDELTQMIAVMRKAKNVEPAMKKK